MPSIHKDILTQIEHIDGGKILFLSDFRGKGSMSAIKMSLSRITTEGRLIRLAYGIYLKPRRSRSKAAMNTPSMEKIAEAIAAREKVRIKPAGEFALYKLGLIEEPPNGVCYITDGEPRNIKIGDKTIVFKSTTPKKLSMKGAISSLLIQIIDEYGQDKISPKKIIELIKKESDFRLLEDLKLAPAWIYNLLFKLNKEIIR